MSLGTVQQGYRRRFYVGAEKEATYDTPSTYTHVFDMLPGGAPSRANVTTETDAALCNAVEFPQKQRYLEQTSSAQFRSYASPEAMGLWGAFAMGDDTVTQVGSGTAYRHTILPSAAGVFPGSTTIEDHTDGATANAASDFELRGIYVSRFSFSWSQTGFSTLEVDLVGSGKTGPAVTQTEADLAKATLYFPNTKVGCWIKAGATQGTSPWSGILTPPTMVGQHSASWAAGSFVSIGQHVESGTFTWQNEYSAQYRAGSMTSAGIYGVQPQVIRRSATMELSLLRDTTTDDYIQALLGGTDDANLEYALGIGAVSDVLAGTAGVFSSEIMLPLVGIEQTPTGDTSDLAKDTITFFAKKTYEGTSDNQLLQPAHMFVTDKRDAVYNQ